MTTAMMQTVMAAGARIEFDVESAQCLAICPLSTIRGLRISHNMLYVPSSVSLRVSAHTYFRLS